MRPFALALALAALLPTTAYAAPHTMSHQGRIMDIIGVPLDGSHTVTFSLFDNAAGAGLLFTEDITTDFTSGYYAFTVNDGDLMDLDILNNELWLEIAIDNAAPIPTRIRLNSVPWAMNSERAEMADHALTADTATNVSGGIIDATEIRINGTTVIDGVGGTLSSMSCAADQVPLYDGSAWGCTGNSAHDHNAAQIIGGTLDVGLLPIGTGVDNVAAGDHIHSFSALTGTVTVSQMPSNLGDIVDAFVVDGDLNLTAGTTVGGAGIQTTLAASAHTAGASAHHIRYSDSEAVSAVGPHLSEGDVDTMVANNGYSSGDHLSESDVDTMVANNGYSSGDHLSESDVDTMVGNNGYSSGDHLSESDVDTMVGNNGYSSGDHLSESDVDTMVGNNGYAAASSLSAVATSGDWNDLTNKPVMVAWHAYNANGNAYSGGNYVVYNGTTVNVGSAYNTSNGIATIPADGDGVYRLCMYTITRNNAAGNTYFDLVINGTNVAAQGGRVYSWNRSSSALHISTGGCVLRQLSAGDTVRWLSQGANSNYPSGHYSYMNGERITF